MYKTYFSLIAVTRQLIIFDRSYIGWGSLEQFRAYIRCFSFRNMPLVECRMSFYHNLGKENKLTWSQLLHCSTSLGTIRIEKHVNKKNTGFEFVSAKKKENYKNSRFYRTHENAVQVPRSYTSESYVQIHIASRHMNPI
jgi:hypothetical protein